jgi:hypothetical protein
MDVLMEFLYGLLKKVIYMRKPMGFARKGKNYWVYRLLRYLYGLTKLFGN